MQAIARRSQAPSTGTAAEGAGLTASPKDVWQRGMTTPHAQLLDGRLQGAVVPMPTPTCVLLAVPTAARDTREH